MKARTLVVGWFSFEGMGATAGDLMARDLACEWLRSAGHEVDYAVIPPFTGGVNWRLASPGDYSGIVFVCGPFGNGEPLLGFFEHFRSVPMIGLDVSMLDRLESWNPFVALWERDSNRTSRPDITFLSQPQPVPVVGTVLIDEQPEYGTNAQAGRASQAIERLIASRDMAVVQIDTCLDPPNRTGLRSAEQINSLIARMDVIITTRLHGTALALKHGVPALVIDSVAGGHKVIRQARTVDWPVAFIVDEIDDKKLRDALDYCLTPQARLAAAECAKRAKRAVEQVRSEFIEYIQSSGNR